MPWVVSDGGRDLRVSLVSYRPPQALQPKANKVLTRHSLPASLGAWSLESRLDKQTVKITHQANQQQKILQS